MYDKLLVAFVLGIIVGFLFSIFMFNSSDYLMSKVNWSFEAAKSVCTEQLRKCGFCE